MRSGTTWEAERRLRSRAEANLGLFTLKQWQQEGLSSEQLRVRCRRGVAYRVFGKVFAFTGSPRTLEFKVLAGSLRAGPVAAGFGATAAAKHGWMQPTEPIHIGTPRRMDNTIPGFRFHRVALSPPEIQLVDGAPVTDHLRTMLDACAELHPQRLARIYQMAKRLGQFTDEEAAIRCEEEARQGRSGITMMRSLILNHAGDYTDLMSDLEARFLSFIRRWGFPEPLRNVQFDVGGAFPVRPDFCWPMIAIPLVVEIDHYFTHGGEDEWNRDRSKDLALQDLGFTIVRLTPVMLDDEPALAHRLKRFFG